MATQVVNQTAATDANAQASKATKKVIRRGVGTARGTSRLKFSHEMAAPNGLFIAHLDDVNVSTIKIGEETTGMPSFNGLEIPRLNFVFASNEADVNKRHYITLSFNAQESNIDTIPGGKDEWKVNMIFDYIKHILNVFILKGRDLTEEEEAALSLPFTDFDEEGNYVSVEPEEIIAGWTTLFNNVANMLNKGNKDGSYYKTADGKPIPLWIKIIRCIKTRKKGWINVNGGELSFPGFCGEGVIERYVPNSAPSIRLDAVTESIVPRVTDKPKVPNAGGVANIGSAPMAGGIPVGDPMTAPTAGAFGNDAVAAAMDDVPF